MNIYIYIFIKKKSCIITITLAASAGTMEGIHIYNYVQFCVKICVQKTNTGDEQFQVHQQWMLVPRRALRIPLYVVMCRCCSVLQCVAVWGSVLQCCSALQFVSGLQCVEVCCSDIVLDIYDL